METNRHHPLLDEEFATERTRKSYNLYVYAERIVATGRINKNEQKVLEESMEKAKRAVTASNFGQKKKKSTEDQIREYKEASLDLRNELVDEEIRVAKLRSSLETSRMSLNVIHANIEKLQTLCRSLSIQSNAVSMGNERLEAAADKEHTHWNKANSKLSLLADRLHILCLESPRMKDHQEKERVAADLQKRILELEQEIERLKMRCNVYLERNASAENVNFVIYARTLSLSLGRLFTNFEKLHTLQGEVDDVRRLAAANEQCDPIEMSLADLDDTAYLLQFARTSRNEVQSQEALPPQATENEVNAAKDRAVRHYVEEQSTVIVQQPQESSPVAHLVEAVNSAENGSLQQEQHQPFIVEAPVSNVASIAITEPNAEETTPAFSSSEITSPLIMETDVQTVLNMSASSADPGADLLSMMGTGKDIGEFDVSSQFQFDGAAGDTGFNFGDDFNSGAPESNFNFNFGSSNEVGDSQFNFDGSQNFGFPSDEMDIDDGACSSSDEEMGPVSRDLARPHTAEIRMDMGSREVAQIVCRTVQVDKEPSRSNAVRSTTVEDSYLVLRVSSVDRRSLQKCIANMFDMCDLAKSTIHLVQQKGWIQVPPANKKAKISSD